VRRGGALRGEGWCDKRRRGREGCGGGDLAGRAILYSMMMNAHRQAKFIFLSIRPAARRQEMWGIY